MVTLAMDGQEAIRHRLDSIVAIVPIPCMGKSTAAATARHWRIEQ
jgi:hypothetical protein